MTVLAHLGTDHWWASLLYLVPVLIVVGGIAITSWRDRRRGPDVEAPGDPDEDGSTPGPTAGP